MHWNVMNILSLLYQIGPSDHTRNQISKISCLLRLSRLTVYSLRALQGPEITGGRNAGIRNYGFVLIRGIIPVTLKQRRLGRWGLFRGLELAYIICQIHFVGPLHFSWYLPIHFSWYLPIQKYTLSNMHLTALI